MVISQSSPAPVAEGGAPGSSTSITRSDLPRVAPPRHEHANDSGEDEEPITDVIRLAELEGMQCIPTSRDRAVLIRMDGAEAGLVFSLGAGVSRIGRHVKNELSIQDSGVSRYHARIVHDGVHHTIEDLGSRNGTFVRGRRVMRGALADGDWVQLGPRASFRYSITDSRQERLLQQLYESSTRDALTGAHNRVHFDERLRTELSYAARHGTTLSLALFDIDHFKRVNDTHGHLAGDQVLRHVARLAARQLRAEDMFARYGGEEFAVLLRGIDLAGCVRVAERLRSTIEVLPAGFDRRLIPITISVGCAMYDESPEHRGESLVARADARLYTAKRTGRNRVVAWG